MMLFNDVGRSQATYTPTIMEGSPIHIPLQPCNEPQQPIRRKRKADPQDAHNERLSKRLSLLNLEQNGPKLYVPVEQPQPGPSSAPATDITLTDVPSDMIPDEPMQLDNSKHKVYIYNLDDELSSENESDVDDRDGRLVFLPDIAKHLRANRIPIPKPILPNKDGELAGMQLVLYTDSPSSISVPVEQDSVRKAIIEARARVREKQAAERVVTTNAPAVNTSTTAAAAASPVTKPTKMSFATPVRFTPSHDIQYETPDDPSSSVNPYAEMMNDNDPDAMDID